MAFDTSFDLPPLRPGAAPTLSISGSQIGANRTQQPAWIRVTSVLVQALRWHFSLASRIEFADLAARVWTPDPQTPIVITSLAEWKPDSSSQRPAILVDRLVQEKDQQTMGIGDQLMGIKQGNFSDFMTGSHVIHCLGGREGEADILATEVWRELKRFAQEIRKAACLLRFRPYQIGKRVQIGAEQKEHYSTPILALYGYEEAWRVTPLDEAEVLSLRTTINIG